MAADFDLHPLRFQPEVRAVVRRSYRCSHTRSNRVRTPEEYDVLARSGDAVSVLELQGDLYFSSTERLFRRVVDDLDGVEFVALDCARVGNLDSAAIAMLSNLRVVLAERGCVMVVADAPVGVLEDIASRSFTDADAAIEWCEEEILAREADALVASTPEGLSGQELLRGLAPDELALIEAAIVIEQVAAGSVVCREGDHADAIYFVLSGLVSVRLPLTIGGRDRRLATLGPGVAVGEMAFLDEGRRSADVVAEQDSTIARLSIESLHELGDRAPHVAAKFSANLARNLSDRLRRVNEQVRMLAQ
jgi:glutaminase